MPSASLQTGPFAATRATTPFSAGGLSPFQARKGRHRHDSDSGDDAGFLAPLRSDFSPETHSLYAKPHRRTHSSEAPQSPELTADRTVSAPDALLQSYLKYLQNEGKSGGKDGDPSHAAKNASALVHAVTDPLGISLDDVDHLEISSQTSLAAAFDAQVQQSADGAESGSLSASVDFQAHLRADIVTKDGRKISVQIDLASRSSLDFAYANSGGALPGATPLPQNGPSDPVAPSAAGGGPSGLPPELLDLIRGAGALFNSFAHSDAPHGQNGQAPAGQPSLESSIEQLSQQLRHDVLAGFTGLAEGSPFASGTSASRLYQSAGAQPGPNQTDVTTLSKDA